MRHTPEIPAMRAVFPEIEYAFVTSTATAATHTEDADAGWQIVLGEGKCILMDPEDKTKEFGLPEFDFKNPFTQTLDEDTFIMVYFDIDDGLLHAVAANCPE